MPIGGIYPHFHDCQVFVVPEVVNSWYMSARVFDRFKQHPFRGFFRESFAMMQDAEVQMFLEWEGFDVVRRNGCFVLKKDIQQVTVSASRARDILLCAIIDVLHG